MDDRGLSPVLGTVLVVALTVVLAATMGAMALTTSVPDGGAGTAVQLSVTADADTDAVTVTHKGGDSLNVATLDVEITIDGTSLKHQPPVPFFAASGFRSGPTGPFNSATTDTWTAGETATLELAGTNDPLIDSGATVTVTVSGDNSVLARLETTAE